MSGLYNVLFGTHSNSDLLLAILGLTPADVPRFRSCYWDGERIVVHTRTGGGNRDYYENEECCRESYPEYFEGDDKPSGPWNDDLRLNPGYLFDQDDDFDPTYADFYFKPPVEAIQVLEGLPPETPPAEQWAALLDRLNSK